MALKSGERDARACALSRGSMASAGEVACCLKKLIKSPTPNRWPERGDVETQNAKATGGGGSHGDS